MPGTSLHDPVDPAASVRRSGRRSGRGRALGFSFAWLAVALGIGVAVGLAVGATARAVSSPSNTWADLAAVIFGVLGWSALVVVASPLVVSPVVALVGESSGARASGIATALLAMVLAPVALVAARVPVAGPTSDAADGSMAG